MFGCKYFDVCGTRKDNCSKDCILIPLYEMRAVQEATYDKEIIIKNVSLPKSVDPEECDINEWI